MTTALNLHGTRNALAAAGGCAAKMGPGTLSTMLSLSGLTDLDPSNEYANVPGTDVLAGLRTGDDAAVVQVSPDLAIVQTVDFFTPVVSDPETFGAIAAANAMSDVFAMGGEVMTALSILAVPEEIEPAVSAAILRGAAAKVREAGGQIVGGHTVLDPKVKFGLAVTGRVHPEKFWARSTARPGDVLFLTKPLGTALVLTADQAGTAAPDHVAAAVTSMLRLNRHASQLVRRNEPNVVTDVTGFGLLGHLAEMVSRSGVGASIDAAAVPTLDGALDAARNGHLCGGLARNHDYWLGDDGRDRVVVAFDNTAGRDVQALLWDPQTSGGLLLAIPERRADEIESTFREADEPLWRVGRVTNESGIRVTA